MKSLQTVQKTFRVIQILTKIAFVFSVVGAAFCAVGALCTVATLTGGQVLGLFGEPIPFNIGGADPGQTMAVLLSDLVFLTTDAVLLSLAGRYCRIEQAEGTPFTENGAEQIRKLGIRCIYLPIVAVVLASVIAVCLGAESEGDVSNLPSLVIGIVLILVSQIFRYGADKAAGLRLNEKLTRLHLGWLVKRMMAGAPPFYYENSFSEEDRKEILASLGKPQTYRTALSEYACVQKRTELSAPSGRLCVPLALVTHDSAISCREIRQFGGASDAQAEKIEALWQDIMDFYLRHADCAQKLRAAHSSHYIHLTDPELVCRLV